MKYLSKHDTWDSKSIVLYDIYRSIIAHKLRDGQVQHFSR